ncbi:MAG: hypothetical protein UY10_C0055G0003 [Microgenomates group bacterium GW2011_GWA2_47_8]|nr:MAG: hypothetical protein UY10_C0055G0003 [Microgenomates group bacterium GW2011_GWA2_47_8]
MKKLYQFSKANIIFLCTLLLLVFIPLYPKLPLVDIRHTWVYVRIEDFAVLFVLFFWGLLVVRKQLSLKTPLTVPILIFWMIGAIATIHGIFLIFSSLTDAYPNVAFLSFVRRVEYMSLFFVSYSAMKDRRLFPLVVAALTVTLFMVSVYGIGQKYFGFPAFLTMNEEFAKGIPIRLSRLSRVSSTFGGHYDLAAYLVLVIPVVVSMVFAFRHWLIRAILLVAALLGFVVLFMTVSRISFFALFVSLGLVLFMQRRKFVLFSAPVVVIVILLIVSLSPSIFDRFKSTIKEIDVLVDAKTGEAVGHPNEVPNTYFANKIVKQQYARSIASLNAFASPSATLVIPFTHLPQNVVLLVEPDAPTGEDLPQGTGDINLSLSPVVRKLSNFYYEPKPKAATTSAEVFRINDNYLLKKVLAYDLSFTTRFQGEWPRALAAFKNNIFFGSGYGSVGLSVDNSYLRMLAEVGLLGLASFLAIFVVTGIYIQSVFPRVQSLQVKSYVIGVIAGAAGLAMNAFFIDVFEASKIAFLLWLLCGIALGALGLYERRSADLYKEFKRAVISTRAIAIYLFVLTVILYLPMIHNNFVGDDFTWLRWAADSPPTASTIAGYFTQAEGFFYRPGAKIYFLIMYSLFWLNQNVYHMASLLLHAVVVTLVFWLAKKIIKQSFFSALAGFLFLILSGYSETIYWISATGFLFTACFSLASLLSYIAWVEKRKTRYWIATLGFFTLSFLFHELGIVTPLFYLLYDYTRTGMIGMRKLCTERLHALLYAPIPVYLLLRYAAHSHWLSGDYNYSFTRLPFNIVGNALAYFSLALVGPFSTPVFQSLRQVLRANTVIAILIFVIASAILGWVYKRASGRIEKEDRDVFVFGAGFFIIALLPFLGLGGFATALSVFFLFQIIQKQQLQRDWHEAGEKSGRFVIAMDGAYEDYWAKEPIEFHFVNVPIRSGEAWIFPVGIPDALWFMFRNPNTRVFSWPSVSAAFDAIEYNSRNQKVFEFDAAGRLTEREKIRNTP